MCIQRDDLHTRVQDGAGGRTIFEAFFEFLILSTWIQL